MQYITWNQHLLLKAFRSPTFVKKAFQASRSTTLEPLYLFFTISKLQLHATFELQFLDQKSECTSHEFGVLLVLQTQCSYTTIIKAYGEPIFSSQHSQPSRAIADFLLFWTRNAPFVHKKKFNHPPWLCIPNFFFCCQFHSFSRPLSVSSHYRLMQNSSLLKVTKPLPSFSRLLHKSTPSTLLHPFKTLTKNILLFFDTLNSLPICYPFLNVLKLSYIYDQQI